MWTVHIVPSIAFCINWACTDVILCDGHRPGLTLFGLSYALVNCIQTKRTGKPLYSVLTWEDYTSPLICLVIATGFNIMFIVSVSLTKAIKPQM